jgi:protein involved in polysaccharide export with SLBB domain
MKTGLKFLEIRTLWIAFAWMLCSTLFAEQESLPSRHHNYDWAYQLKEEIQHIPSVTPQASEASSVVPSTNQVKQSSWPRGAPKNLLKPVKPPQSAKRKPSKAPPKPTPGRKPTQDGIGQLQHNQPTTVDVNINLGHEDTPKAATNTPAANVISTQTSRLERLYGGKFERKADRNLQQFGYQIFTQSNEAEFPSGPTPASYVLDSGDEILLTLSGTVDAFHKLTIDRDGVVSIPEFGTLPLAGVRYGDLHDTLLAFLEQHRRNFELKVSLGGRRSIQVNIIGRVKQPGRVEIPALSNPIIALSAAGGIQKDGSLRNIILTRTNADGSPSESVVDLYDFLRNPELAEKYVQLREDDTLYVPAIGPTVGIAGYVQEPGIYEINSDAFSIADALELSGGLTPFSFTPLARIERTIDGRGRKRSDIELTAKGLKEIMKDGELLMIEAVDDKRQSIVRIEGEVARPGDFEYTEGMTLSELIERADGLTIDAYLKQAFISRQIGEPTDVESIPGRGSQQQSRRVLVAQLDKALMKDAAHDFVLMPLDLVTIRPRDAAMVQPVVEIIGSVQRPGTYELTASMRVSELIAIAGNLTPDVYYDEAELIRRYFDSSARQLDVKRYRFNLQEALAPENLNSDDLNPILSNGDKLVIRSLQKAQVRVQISGRVRFPGEYIFPDGAKITDLITAAGGILDDADLRASIFTRQSTKQLQQTRLDHLIERTRRLAEAALERMVQTGRPKEGLAAKIAAIQTQDVLNRAMYKQAQGRIVVPFNTPDFPQTAYNLPLQSGDALTIPHRHSTVSVAGDVFRPVTFIVNDRVAVKDALEKAGGITEMADADLIYVIRANGEVERANSRGGFMRRKTYLYAGDVLLAPTAPMERTMFAKFSDYALLGRQLAEIAVITTNIDEETPVTLVSPYDAEASGVDSSVLVE